LEKAKPLMLQQNLISQASGSGRPGNTGRLVGVNREKWYYRPKNRLTGFSRCARPADDPATDFADWPLYFHTPESGRSRKPGG
jgi:hypothetical protein